VFHLEQVRLGTIPTRAREQRDTCLFGYVGNPEIVSAFLWSPR